MMENKNQRFFKFDYIKPSFIFIYKNMAVRTALLTSRNITLDTDFSKYIESITTPWMIKGKEFTVTASSVSAGTAFVPCTRTNGETIYALVQNFSPVSISGNGYVIIKVDDSIVDNGGGNEDGTGIATIEVVASLPSKNYLHLATITNGTVTMVAPTIKKLNELDTQIQSIFTQLADLDQRVENLEEADAIDHLEESGLVWELYTLNDTLFKQYAPTLANSTLEANVGDVAANTQIHIQAMGSGVASNKLKLKVKMAWAPTTSLKVEVRKGIQVTVTANKEAYWYGGGELLATGTLASSSFSTDWKEVTFNLDNEVGGNKWELLNVVVYQTTGSGATVNASNYYVLACDSTQYSEAFSYVSVNGSTRARSKLMPYLSSDGFAQAMLCKTKTTDTILANTIIKRLGQTSGTSASYSGNVTQWANMGSIKNEYSNPITVKLHLNHLGWLSGGGSSGTTYIKLGTNESNATVVWSGGGTAPKKITTNNVTIPAGATYNVYNGAGGASSSGTTITFEYTEFILTEDVQNSYDKKTYTTEVKGIPTSIREIGNQASFIFYGVYNNTEYIGGIMLEKTTTATTGNITLWNAVGYISVNLNGEIIKIPYYN